MTTWTSTCCDFAIAPIKERPFPHILKDEFVDRVVYKDALASFPKCLESTGPTGFSTYWGDALYDSLIESEPAWGALHRTFHSQAFVDYIIKQFKGAWERHGCQVSLSDAKYVPFRESREAKEKTGDIDDYPYASNELFVRMDIHQGHLGYHRAVHLDHTRRLASMLIYLCDKEENKMVGGDLIMEGAKRKPWAYFKGRKVIAPKHNRMAAFPVTPNSWHSVPVVKSQTVPRNFLQVTISSPVVAW